MKLRLLAILAALSLSFSIFAQPQAPAGAPSGANGVCNDGTYSTTASKRGACAGHKGVKTWFAAGSAAPATSPTPAVPAATAASSTPSAAPSAAPNQRAQAPGGGGGQVWVNTSSNVYHCQGDRSYGTTKAGQYMSEADAKGKGARPAYGKTCTK